jgi:hypothetical protein
VARAAHLDLVAAPNGRHQFADGLHVVRRVAMARTARQRFARTIFAKEHSTVGALGQFRVLGLVADTARASHLAERRARMRDRRIETGGIASVTLVALDPLLVVHIPAQKILRHEVPGLLARPQLGCAVTQYARIDVVRYLRDAGRRASHN